MLTASWPNGGVRKGATVSDPVSSLDLYPTALYPPCPPCPPLASQPSSLTHSAQGCRSPSLAAHSDTMAAQLTSGKSVADDSQGPR